ncbi:MAG: hypothetical protein LAT67_10160 [Balneolales bacterium]|nr:hypothetical protein [Balneolales bacterium]
MPFVNLPLLLRSILFAAACLLILGSESRAQGFTSPISWHNVVFDARVSALGQSTAALHNGSAYQMNPAVPFENGVIRASGYLFFSTPFTSEFTSNGPNLYSPAIGFSSGRLSYMVMLDQTTYTIPTSQWVRGGDITNTLLRFQVGYQLNERFSLGAGYVYSSYNSPTGSLNMGSGVDGNASAWGLTFGAYFTDHIETSAVRFTPQAGLSLNDLSTGFKREGFAPREQMPGQIRLGFGMDINSIETRYNLPLFGGGVYTGFSKYLSRWETDPDTFDNTSPSGFESLFTSWNSINRFDGMGFTPITLGEQISASMGLEAHILQTLYLRYGILGGADFWVRPQHGLGIEIDLYYIALSVTNISYHSSDRWLPQDDVLTFQATVRVPIDGKPRNTLLTQLLRR